MEIQKGIKLIYNHHNLQKYQLHDTQPNYILKKLRIKSSKIKIYTHNSLFNIYEYSS